MIACSKSSGVSNYSANAFSFAPESKPGRFSSSSTNALFARLGGTSRTALVEEFIDRRLIQFFHRKRGRRPVALHFAQQRGQRITHGGKRRHRLVPLRRFVPGCTHAHGLR